MTELPAKYIALIEKLWAERPQKGASTKVTTVAENEEDLFSVVVDAGPEIGLEILNSDLKKALLGYAQGRDPGASFDPDNACRPYIRFTLPQDV